MANYRVIELIAGLIFISSVNGQVFKEHEAQRFVQNSKKVWLNTHDSTLKYIEFKEYPKSLKANRKLKLEEALNLPSEITFSETEKSKDKLGIEHTRNQQKYRGIPVVGGMYYLHGRDGNFQNANGEYYMINNLEIKPRLRESEAYKKAAEFINSKKYSWETNGDKRPKGLLVVLPIENSSFLAYKYDIYSIEPFSRNFVYVDASNGKILKVEDRLRELDASGTAITKYNQSQSIKTEFYDNSYRLRENDRGNGIQTYNLKGSVNYLLANDFTDSDNFWNTTSNQDDAATSVHYAIEKTFDFFMNNFGRNSFDNNGGKIYNYIHYGSACNNAFWDGSKLFFGDGDGLKYSAFTSTDIVAHEFTHAITQHTADLAYIGESGALNESFSDIFGVAVDYFANPSTANFIIGDPVFISGPGMRNMGNPNQMNGPDTYKGLYWYTNQGDNGGVHTNCGVQNYWFYLLCNGGSGTNDIGSFYNISGIGMDKALAVAYRNLTVYLTSNSDYEDARFYSIQAAVDLFGECSNEVIAVTNSWYAVGVGSEFSNDINTLFEVSQKTSCSVPFSVDFFNKSRNATEYLWNFGDGNSSTLQNPSHIYTENGNYTVSLIATGNQICNLPDTMTKENLISITASYGLTGASCKPKTIIPSLSGILNFTFGDINNSSESSIIEGGYIDYTCLGQSVLKAGEKIPISITTNKDSDEDVRIWLDLNNDGAFLQNELIFSSDEKTGVHTGFIIVPTPLVFNNLLRLRVASDLANYNIFDACADIQYGQVEDYAVAILPNNIKPVADFSPVNGVTLTGDSVIFNNLSLNVPETFEWSFPGGNPAQSSLKNPKTSYPEAGDYNVSLIVKNAFGSDTLILNEIVKVRKPFIMKTDSNSSDPEGLLFDSGGQKGKYFNNENSGFLIEVPCASEIRLVFQLLDIESCCDYIQIYDGTGISGKLLYPLSGLTKSDTLVAKSGSVFITFNSDASMVRKGFIIEWTSKDVNTDPVIAGFSVSKTFAAYNEIISFNNNSSDNAINWTWDFGDGSVSTLKNPSHNYKEAGLKNITLLAYNCYSSDSITKQLVISSVPSIEVDAQLFNVQLKSGETTSRNFKIINTGNEGVLIYSIQIIDLTGNDEVENCEWLEIDKLENEVDPNSSDNIGLTIDASELIAGYYLAKLVVKNNDPSDSLKNVMVVLNVVENDSKPFQISIPDQVLYLNKMHTINLVDFNLNIIEPNLKISLLNSDSAIVQAEILNSELIIHPLALGKSVLSLSITQGAVVSSDTFSVDVIENGSIELDNNHISDDNILRVYPNPVRDKIFFKSNVKEGQQFIYSIYNVTGEIILKDNFELTSDGNQSGLNVIDLKQGIYILELTDRDQKYTCKFIKE